MKLQPLTAASTLPCQLLCAAEVATLLGIPERTFRDAPGVLRELKNSAVSLGKHQRWQYGFVIAWIEGQQRQAAKRATDGESAEAANIGHVLEFPARTRRKVTTLDADVWAEARAQRAKFKKRGKA